MRRALLGILCSGILVTASGAPSVAGALSPEARRSMQREATLMIDMLQGYHYSDRSFRELRADEFLERYLDGLDPERLFLLASDVEYFHRRFDRNMKSIYLFRGDVQPGFEIFDRVAERIRTRTEWALARLGQGVLSVPVAGAGEVPVWSEEDSLAAEHGPGRRGLPWAADERSLDARWERRLRRAVLNELLRGRSLAEAHEWIRDQYKRRLVRLRLWDAQVVRERFLNSMLESFDAHSGYFSRESAEAFTQAITGSSLGVGLDFELHGEHLHVSRVVEGGPADLDGRITRGERLWAMAEAGAEKRDASSWTMHELHRALQGAEGSRLTLWLGGEQGDGLHAVELVRTRHERPDGHASAALVQVPSGGGLRKVGLIRLPAFFVNPQAEGGASSTSAEMRELIGKLAQGGAEALVLDLRDNGGGVMEEARRTAGLFIRKGPLFQTRGLDRKVSLMEDEDETLAWGGPLVVLVSANSASASEAFAGTMQWHGRALVVGAESTFGKGSAQDYIDMRTLSGGGISAHQDEWGVLRLTRMLFYFPDGRSPQLHGVRSDIVLPETRRDRAPVLESQLPNALPNETIPPAAASPGDLNKGLALVSPPLVAALSEASVQRRSTLPEFGLATSIAAVQVELRSMQGVPLTQEAWLASISEREARRVSLVLEWRALMSREGFVHAMVPLDAVQRVEERHREALRRAGPGGRPREGRVLGGICHVDTQAAEGEDLVLEELDLGLGLARPAPLEEAWRAATGSVPREGGMVCALRRLRAAIAEDGIQPDVVAVLCSKLGTPVDTGCAEVGAASVMRGLNMLGRSASPGAFPMDLHRREALRIAADWALQVGGQEGAGAH